MKKIIQRFISCCLLLLIAIFSGNAQFTISSTSIPPVNPLLNQIFLQSGNGIRVTLNYQMADQTLSPPITTSPPPVRVRISGRIQRLSPSPFTIELATDTSLGAFVSMAPMSSPITLNKLQLEQAFGNFDASNLIFNGIPPIGPNDKLPEGIYNICFTAQAIKYHQNVDPGCCPVNSVPCNCPQRCGCWIQNQYYEQIGFTCANFITCSQPLNGVSIITIAAAPINPIISQAILTGGVISTLQFANPATCTTQVKLYGKIERISPSPFIIELDPSPINQPLLTLNGGIPKQLTPGELLNAFDGFKESSLKVTGVNLSSIRDANNQVKLPDGNYKICFYAKYQNGNDASSLSCASFTLCNKAGGAPQFIQPVNNVNINSDIPIIQPVSPVIFSWTPPQSTCGLPPSKYIYDLEIWELNPNQNVNDAVNNPYVFRKRSLPSTTFLLDLNLNKDVLKTGKRYAMRVRAEVENANPNSPVEIENDGYSRIEAFQYGTGIVPPPPLFDPKEYFIEFKERKSSYWDDVKRRGHDTLVPIKEYIAFVLTQNRIGYSEDAIEMLIALNPELAEMKKVKMSYVPNLPVFPSVSASDQRKFDKEHEANLEPDKAEENKFLRYLDTLNNQRPRVPEKAISMINDLVRHLNSIKPEINSVDRVTVNYINQVLAEFLFQLRIYSGNSSNIQYNQLQKLATTLRELTIDSLDGSSFILPKKINAPVSNQSGPSENSLNTINPLSEEDIDNMPLNLIKQLLPYDVVVWRPGTVAPYKPVFDAPDLKTTFRIYYTLSNLYNHRNPEVNAQSSTRLASTIQVSLPSNSTYSFWTLNMENHKTTTAENVDLKDVYQNSMKREPSFKKPTVVIKVE